MQHFGIGLNTFVSRWGYFIAKNSFVHKMRVIRTIAVDNDKNRLYERWVYGKTEKCNVFGKENVR